MSGIDIANGALPPGRILSEEQQAIIDQPPNQNIVVDAAAGSGKTTTLVDYANRWRDQRGLYLAFNRDIADSAQSRFPPWVRAQTMHSYAYKALNVSRFKDRLKGRINRQMIRQAGIDLASEYLTPDRMIRCIMQALVNFCIDGGTELKPEHCGLDKSPPGTQAAVLPRIAAVVKRFLDYETSGLPFTHDMYLKRLEMGGTIGELADYIMIDEAQDSNGVTLSLAKKSGKPIIFIGDPKQCLAPGQMVLTPNGLVAVEDIREGDLVISADGRGRTKIRRVTAVHTSQARNGLVKVITKGGKEIVSTPDHTHFAGFQRNSGQAGWNVYLMYRSDRGYRIGMSCTYDSRGREHNGWKARSGHEHADHTFVLATGLEREDAAVMEQVLSLRYGIPTIVFKDRGQSAFGEAYLDKVFKAVDTRANAARLLADMGIDGRRPHHIPKSMGRDRRNFSICMCGDHGMHRYAISGSNPEDAAALNALGIKTRSAKNGNGWRIESSTRHLGAIYDMYDRIREVMDVNLIEAAQLADGASVPLMPASNCLPGMEICVRDNQSGEIVKDEIAAVERIPYEGPVYDIDVEFSHNLIANDVVTHNSIYAFRGAINAMENVDGPRFPLSMSWRFGPQIADLCNHILSFSDHPPKTPIRGRPDRETKIEAYTGRAPARSFILSRTNARLFEGLIAIPPGTPFYIAGGFDVLANQLLSAYALSRNEQWKVTDPYVRGFSYWEDMVEESIEDDPDAKKLVKIVKEYGDQIPGIIDRLRAFQRPHHQDAQVLLSTAHKAKGLEADSVVVLDDFPTPKELQARLLDDKLTQIDYEQEINLLYVAVSRAKHRLLLASSLYEEVAHIVTGGSK